MNILRGLLFNLFYFLSVILYSVPAVIITPFLDYPTRVRYYTTWPNLIQWLLKVICGIQVEVIGKENIPKEPVVIVANHQSTWETFIMFNLFTPVTIVLKKELTYIPIFGWLLHFIRPISIDRGKRAAAMKQILKQGQDRLAQGISILIFPEGTRVPVGENRSHFSGGTMLAVKAKCPVLPVAHNSGCFWPAHKVIKNPGVITVKIGKPIATEGRSAKELSLEMENWINEEKTILSNKVITH